MNRIILWILNLVVIAIMFGHVSFAEEVTSEDTERTLRSRVIDFFLTPEDSVQIPTSDSIAVIASRLPSFKKSLNDIPSNVTYLDKNDLKNVKPRSFQEAVQQIEGATFADSVGNTWDTNFGLRGFAGSSNINFLVDGVRVNEPDQNVVTFPLISADDLESIQIDRGSSSPVYGTQAFAGVVNITTGQPSKKRLSLFGGFEWGSFNSLKVYQGLSGTIKDNLTPLAGNYKYYFRAGRNVGDGWRPNNDWRITSFDIKNSYELPDDQGRAYINVKHMNDVISNPGEVSLQQYRADYRQTNKSLDGRRYHSSIIQVGADKKFWDNHITASIMNSWRPNSTRFYSTVGSFVPFFAPTQNPYTSVATVKSKDQNLIAQVKYEDYFYERIFNETQIGFEYRDQDHLATEQDAPNGISIQNPLRTDRDADINNTALFWRETLKFWDKVSPYFGMRHDHHSLKTTNFLNQLTNVSRRWRASTISTGVNITPLSFSDLFFNYSQGFRVPSISEVSPFSSTVPAPDLDPESSDSYEIGTRLRYKDAAAYKMSYFLIDTKDEIAFVINQNVNINKSRRYGIEQRIDLKPIDELSFYGTYTWMRAYVRETATGTPVDGRELGQIPENRFTMGATATPFSRVSELLAGLKFNFYGVITGTQHPESFQSYSQANLNRLGSEAHEINPYSVWNFMMSYEWRNKLVYFKINNIFNAHYYSRARVETSSGTAIYTPGSYVFVNQGAPREYLIGSTWEFGN